MANTRKELKAANTQLSAQLAVHNHETRKGLTAKLAAARDEAKRLLSDKAGLETENASLRAKVKELQPA